MNNLFQKSIFLFSLLVSAFTAIAASEYGDRHPGTELIYPKDAYLQNGGPVIDVTQPPFSAKGDGITDDTEALIKAYDFVLNELRKSGGPQNSPEHSYIIYLPEGEYLVSKSIVFSEDFVWMTNPVGKRLSGTVFIRWIGQNREKTIIRLKDNSEDFQARLGTPVLSLERMDFNNAVAYHSIRHLTINTGKSNPGASGIRYAGANNSGLRDISVISGDGTGHTGILVNVETSMGYWSDISIKGFNNGVVVSPAHMTHISMEYISLEGQKKAGIVVDNASISVRKLYSNNSVPALIVNGGSGMAFMMESELVGGASGQSAINHSDGVVIARQVATKGYDAAIKGKGYGYKFDRKGAEIVRKGPDIDLYIGEESYGPPSVNKPQFLNLPIDDIPAVNYSPDPNKWANVNDFGAVGDGATDDSRAIQNACNSGAEIIYFPNRIYKINNTIEIPSSVKIINFMYCMLKGDNFEAPLFRVDKDSEDIIVFEDLRSKQLPLFLEHKAPRTIVMRHIGVQGQLYQNSNKQPGVKLFLENVNGLGRTRNQLNNEQKVWARFINTEFKGGANFIANNCDMWVFGYKVESGSENFLVCNGARLEVLGGIANMFSINHFPTESPILRIEDGEASFTAVTNGPSSSNHGYTYAVINENGPEETYLLLKNTPDRRKGSDHFIPLYSTKED